MSKVEFLSLVLMAALTAISVLLLIKSKRPFAVGLSAFSAMLFAVVSGFLVAYIISLTGYVPEVSGATSFSNLYIVISNFVLVGHEEFSRVIFIFLLFLRPTHNHKPVYAPLLAFGFMFGLLEFMMRLVPIIWTPGECEKFVTPLSCDDGSYYLMIAFLEPVIFHALVCWAFYSQMNFSKKLSWRNFLIFVSAVVFHAALNLFKFFPLWDEANSGAFVYTPLSYFALYAVIVIISLRTRSYLRVAA